MTTGCSEKSAALFSISDRFSKDSSTSSSFCGGTGGTIFSRSCEEDGDTRIVNPGVETTKFSDRPLGNAINVLFLPYIGGNIDRLTAFAANLVNNLAEGILIAGCKDKLRAFLCSHSGGVTKPIPLEAPVMTMTWSWRGLREIAITSKL
jgi:hypothetical protein